MYMVDWLSLGVGDNDMKTVAIMSQKGGVGKSTIAVNLAVAAVLAGKAAGIVDMDPQGSASLWGDDREGKAPSVVSVFPSRLPGTLKQAEAAGAKYVFLDSAPRSSDHKGIAECSDLILIPCRPSRFDFASLQDTWDLTTGLKKPTYILFNGVGTYEDSELEDAKEPLVKAGYTSFAPVIVHTRKAFQRSLRTGRGVMETEPRSRAAEEILALYKWCVKVVGR